MKRILYILTAVFCAGACADLNGNPYEDALNVLTVDIMLPEGFEQTERAGFSVIVEDMNAGSRYSVLTDADGNVSFNLPDGLYRLNISGKSDGNLFNGSADKITLSDNDMSLTVALEASKAGTIVIKEVYCGGCKKLPQEGNYQSDQYFILHNNHYEVQYLDSLCFGTLSPYNSNATNNFVTKDPQTGESVFPDFVPIIQAVWQFPGDGNDFPLNPGEDAVICLKGAIDHTLQYPLSVNLNHPEYFVCYNITYFPNPVYHPVPGDRISLDRYIDVVIKTGQANAYTFSISSPTLVVWKPRGMTMHEFVSVADNLTPVPGSTIDDVVKVPYSWVIDAMEVFDARNTNNTKRLAPSADAGYVLQTDTFLGRSLMRHIDEDATASAGYEVLADSNNSLNDFYETDKQSLHE